VADLDVGWLREQIEAHGLPPGSSVTVADRGGRVLIRLPDRRIEGTILGPTYRWMLDQPEPGVVEGVGSDGVRRIIGYQPLAAPPADLFVCVGLSTQYAFAASDAAAARGYTLIGIGLIAALGLAMWMLRGTIARPVGAILRTTERWRAGDTRARVTLPDEGSEFSRIADAINDLVETIVAQEAGQRARLAELDAIYSAAPVGLCFFDHEMRFVIGNAALAEINGVPVAAQRGKTVRELLPVIADRVEPPLIRALAGERVPPSEVTGTTEAAPGVPRRLLVGYQPAVAADGQVLGAICAVQDVTALRRVESTLQETLRRANAELEARVAERTRELRAEVAEREAAQAQLQQAQKMELLGQLTGGIAHDFNNLLTALIGNLELAMARVTDRPETLRLLAAALRAADRGAALTQRMLAIGRRQYLRIEPVSIAALLEGMGELLARAIAPPVAVRIEAARNLPPAYADSNQIELLVLNLVVNARDAMPEGGVITIAATLERFDEAQSEAADMPPGRYVRVSVRDTGIGMDPETKARAFEPFYTTKPPGHGSGLGLSMVQGVALQSGGSVSIESEPGQGTSVSVWLPCDRAAPAAPRAQVPDLAAPPG